MIIYVCNDLRAVGMAHEQSSPYFVLDEENNCMVTTYQIRDTYMKIGDSYAGRSNLINDFSDFHYSGNLKNSTSSFYHKGYVELNNNMRYFEPYVDLKNYVQIRKSDAHMYSNVKNLTLCNEDFYPDGRYLILKDQLIKGKSLIGYLYDFYINYYRSNNSLYVFINTRILDAIINCDSDNKALYGYDTSIFNDKEKWQKLVSISIKIKNHLSILAKYKEEISNAINAYSGDLEDLYFSENDYE